MLFSSGSRFDRSARRESETLYTFLERVDGPGWQRCREMMEHWLASVHQEREGKRLVDALRVPDRDQQHRAFWELYLYEALRRNGADVTLHPTLPGTTKQLDMLVTGPAETFYLEATSAWRMSQAKDEQHRLGSLIDNLQARLQSSRFSLDLEIRHVGPEHFDSEALTRALLDWTTTLDPETVRIAYIREEQTGEQHLVPSFPWLEAGWSLMARPVTPRDGVVQSLPPIGMHGPSEAHIVNVRDPLHRNYRKKANRYGTELGRPFVIGLVDLGEDRPHFDMAADVFYGTSAAVLDPRTYRLGPMFRQPDGLWHGPDGPMDRHVSAVVLAWDMLPHMVNRATVVVVHNPWASHPLNSRLPWPSIRLGHNDADLAYSESPTRPSKLFGLPDDWPGDLWGPPG
jgi:hypothetical protein